VLSKNSFDSEALGGHHDNMRENACALMTVHDVHPFSDEDLADERKAVEEREEGHVALESREVGKVVNFHSISHVPDSIPLALELVGHEAHLVASFNQALGQLVAMGLHSSKLGEGKVCANEHAVARLVNFRLRGKLAVEGETA
jgi:hypothetical protein